MKEKYNKPTLEIIEFTAEDIITTSGGDSGCNTYCKDVCIPDCQRVG